MDNNSTPNNPQRRIRLSINDLITPISQNQKKITHDEESRRSSASSLGILEIDTLSDIGNNEDIEENFDLKSTSGDKFLFQENDDFRLKRQKALASKAIGKMNKKDFDQHFKENIYKDLNQSNDEGKSKINSVTVNGVPSYLLRPDDSLDFTFTNSPKIPLIKISDENKTLLEKDKSNEKKLQSFSFSSMSLGEFRPAEEAMSLLEEQNWQNEGPVELKDIEENKRISDFSNAFSEDHQISVNSSKFGRDYMDYKGTKLSPSKYFRIRSELMMPIENPLQKSPDKEESILNTSVDSILSISKISKLVSEKSSFNIVDQLLTKTNISPKVLKDKPIIDNKRPQSLGCPCNFKTPSPLRSRSVSPRLSPNVSIRKSRSVSPKLRAESPNSNCSFQNSLTRRNIENQFKEQINFGEWDESCRMSSMSNISEAFTLEDSEVEEPWLFIPEHDPKIVCLNDKYIQEYISFHNMTGRVLLCTICLDHVLGGNGNETIKWPQQTVTFTPSSSKDCKIWIRPKINGHLDLFFKISIQDKNSKREQVISHQMKFIVTATSSKDSSISLKNASHLSKHSSCSSNVDSGRASLVDNMTNTSSTHSAQSYENFSRNSQKNFQLLRESTPNIKSPNKNMSETSTHRRDSKSKNKETVKIQSTATEVTWASIPVGTRKTQTIKVRHFGPLCKIQVTIFNDSTNSFSVLNENGEWVSAYHFIQKDEEITTLKFGLMPRTTAYCSAIVQISAILNEKKSSRNIPLFGFGGEAHIILKGVKKVNAGQLTLKIGKLRVMERQRRLGGLLHIRNDGSIPGFLAVTKIIPELTSLSLKSLKVTPRTFILPPGFSQTINIEYRVNMDDVKCISQSKHENNVIASLNIFYGDEYTRSRLCNIYENYPDKEFPEKLKYLVDNKNFSKEFQIQNINNFKDPWSAVTELSLTLNDIQISLEVERELEEGSLLIKAFEKTEEHLMFKTLVQDQTCDSINITEMGPPIAPPLIQSTTRRSFRPITSIRIEPTTLFFSSQIKHSVLIIYNLSPVMQTYEIQSRDNNLFSFSSMGHISPGEEKPIHITSNCNPQGSFKTLISVFVENDKIDIPVTFLP